MDEKISYYDILTMIKNGNIPPRIMLYVFDECARYYFSSEDNSYLLEETEKESDNFKAYLNECLTDVQYLDKCFTIVEQKNND